MATEAVNPFHMAVRGHLWRWRRLLTRDGMTRKERRALEAAYQNGAAAKPTPAEMASLRAKVEAQLEAEQQNGQSSSM
jgi:hypothetical protein